MRRIDVIGIGLVTFLVGGGIYLILQWVGLDTLSAGVWSQVFLVAGLIVWVLTYLFRALTKNMTYNQQLKDYEDAVLQKRLEELSPEQVAELQAEIERERSQDNADDTLAASEKASSG
ncbi:MAG: DUF3007 family protein [Leptolyngbyaceae cyanobacterium MO_188.B28]|nr:DUF3007 family protein [Leptolyngbyaceae cyanobacterium MO_188.B28]